jgi:hypothetical protein
MINFFIAFTPWLLSFFGAFMFYLGVTYEGGYVATSAVLLPNLWSMLTFYKGRIHNLEV